MKVVCIAFYNIENLFDTVLNRELSNNEEFTPEGMNRWDTEKYYAKLRNIAEVISQIGTDVTPDGPAIIGLSELENKNVLEDLVKEPAIQSRKYQIAHHDSPDRRGVDVAFLFRPDYFTPTATKAYTLRIEGDTGFRTRDQFLLSGILDGEKMHMIVNHWPSRRGGEKASRPLRNAAGILCRHITDSLLTENSQAKVFIMGDLNDDPVNPSVRIHLKATSDKSKLSNGYLFNPMEKMYKDGIGSLAYRDTWDLFDQIIMSPALVSDDYRSYRYHSARVFNKGFLIQKDGAFAGYPFRSFAGGVYLGGYSDHLPVYVILVKEP